MIRTYNKYKTGYHFNIKNELLVIIQSLNACDIMSENVVVFILMMCMPFGFLPPKDFNIIWISNILALSARLKLFYVYVL